MLDWEDDIEAEAARLTRRAWRLKRALAKKGIEIEIGYCWEHEAQSMLVKIDGKKVADLCFTQQVEDVFNHSGAPAAEGWKA